MSGRAQAASVALPYPHARNDCDGCRERDAEMRAHYEGLQGRDLRWCQRCAGSALEGLVLMGLTVTVTPREEQQGVEPYDEDGYCESCGNGRWKHHTPDCAWADQRDGQPFEQGSEHRPFPANWTQSHCITCKTPWPCSEAGAGGLDA